MNKWLLIYGLAFIVGTGLFRNVLKDIIRQFEGLSLVPYQDTGGAWTIGYGHKIVPGDPYYPYGPVKEITEADANALLAKDTATAQAAVKNAVRVPVTKKQLDAMTSLAYNIGGNAFKNSTLVAKLNTGDYTGAANEFGKWIYDNGKQIPGLISRRAQEMQLFLS